LLNESSQSTGEKSLVSYPITNFAYDRSDYDFGVEPPAAAPPEFKYDVSQVQGTIKEISEECLGIYTKAHKEYAHDDQQPFRNFESIADQLGMSREKVCLVYLLKHLHGITAHVDGLEAQREPIGGRFRDLHNYLFILECMLNEGRMNAG